MFFVTSLHMKMQIIYFFAMLSDKFDLWKIGKTTLYDKRGLYDTSNELQ